MSFYNRSISARKGQSLLEVLLSVVLGVMMTVAAALVLAPLVRTGTSLERLQTGNTLSKELLENVRSFTEENWHNIYDLGKSSSSLYYLTTSTPLFTAASGTETIVISNTPYQRFFYVENVTRNASDLIVPPGSPGTGDPSAQRVTIGFSWPGTATRTISQYLFRTHNKVLLQTDWSSGPKEPPETLIIPTSRFATSSFVDYTSSTGSLYVIFGNTGQAPDGGSGTNIDPINRWAWNETIGWTDFYETNTVRVTGAKLTGYASSSVGDISLDCATTRIGDICSRSNYGVQNNGVGTLSGWAWNDGIGWISFSGTAENGSPYGVLITNGDFSGYAWNDLVGWLSFNCINHSICPPAPSYKVKTTWRTVASTGTLDSAIFDTEIGGGAQLNSMIWRGSKPPGTDVYFQIAPGGCVTTGTTILALQPNGNGTPIEFLSSTGGPNWINVDEVTADDDASYNYSTFPDKKDLFNFPDNIDRGLINQVKLSVTLKGSVSFNGRADLVLKTYGTEYSTTQGAISSSYGVRAITYVNNPFTGLPWTWAEVNALEAGYRSRTTASGAFAGELRVTWVSVTVNYTESCAPPSTWIFVGPDNTPNTYYLPTQRPDGSFFARLQENYVANKRFYRYRVFFQSDANQTVSPRVDDIIINWSP